MEASRNSRCRSVMSPLDNVGPQPTDLLLPAAKRLRVVFAPNKVVLPGSNLSRGSNGDSGTGPRPEDLHLAAGRGNVNAAVAMLRLCNINAVFNAEVFGWRCPHVLHTIPLGGWTTIIGASYHGHASVVRVLLADRRLCPNMHDTNGDSALFHASALGHAQVVALLLSDERVNPNMPSQYGWTPIIRAAANGHASTVMVLLGDERTDPNTANQFGYTALIWSCNIGHVPVVKLLLAHRRVNPNMANQYGTTALIWSVRNNVVEAVKLLLADERVDPNHRTHFGLSALHYAVRGNNAEIVALLLADSFVDPNLPERQGSTALIAAACAGNLRVLELLLTDHRTIRTRPAMNGNIYDAALFNVKYPRHARFKGLVRAVVAFRRMRLRAAQAVYIPGGAGLAAAAASFNTTMASSASTPDLTPDA